MFSRTERLLGKDALQKLCHTKVAIFGIGGVGSYVAEALARTGVGHLVLIDSDDIVVSNINRQIHATQETIGKSKVEVMKKRILSINPNIEVITFQMLYNKETAAELLSIEYDYVVDAIDMVTSKLDLIERCTNQNIPIISAMGAGNKLDPTKLEVTDIYKTSVCPLAKVMRHELKKRGIKKLKVVYSKEMPVKPLPDNENGGRKQIPSSAIFVPATAGLVIASEVVRDIEKKIEG
ncbi:tRNA cyclic N6-threonylcarbamoyladenosine(37) synthase TcdA [Candidatus Epulonipiscium fishelsonii]|uniref:tRNA cyclic N6-threonylcarbamoyladenosine(37) synthase TcdA n=1 Tax=Candidatus Epulonipiscium fishelsonii TaxID=77094 RepID=A0ACC8XGN1_9FIRM|nr:tRNA cyclic N6-threonylcarbamoyladenosine(37) synthase TcdA [Epulopiscium sp. SCG-B05WGA-EpuloA1]ONI42698.1 tRNA cyclic N6-threonylcarbamoyladenosine(37) synthase TcdA [Epulopiscium sp. SCG-B11WGA-EpuloA1]